MSWYATEQLARQRRDQFATEARGDSLVRVAQGDDPTSRPSVGPSRSRRVTRLMSRVGGAMLAGVSHLMRQRRGATESPIDGRAIGSRNV